MSKAQILPRNVSTASEAFAHPDALVKDICLTATRFSWSWIPR